MHFATFLSCGFITAIVVNSPERKLSKRTSVQCARSHCYNSESNNGYPSLHNLEQKINFWSTVGCIILGRVIKRNLHAMLLLQIPFLLNGSLQITYHFSGFRSNGRVLILHCIFLNKKNIFSPQLAGSVLAV